MKSQAENNSKEQQTQAAQATSEQEELFSEQRLFADNRPIQQQLAIQQKAMNSSGEGSVVDNRNSQRVQRKLIKGIQSKTAPIMQRQVFHTPGYNLDDKETDEEWTNSLKGKIISGWQRLDDATQQIKTGINKMLQKGQIGDSKYWGSFIKNPSAKSYGYLVEEELNKYAAGMGWGLQTRLQGARPDFTRKMGGKWVMADLTTTRESQGSGMHLNKKLDKSNFKGADFVVGADITYDRGEEVNLPIIPARQTCTEIYDRIFKERDDDDYDPMNDYLRHRLPKLPEYTETDPDVWEGWLDDYELIRGQFEEEY